MYHWSEISDVPSNAGVYAWYYEVRIGKKDIDSLKNDIEEAKNDGTVDPIEVVKSFLYENIFKFFEEGSYNVDVYGKLKPSYKGGINNKSDVSTSLSERVLENPNRIEKVKKHISGLAPKFSSPIYIGKSENLWRRLSNHKKMIRNFKKGEVFDVGKPSRDKNFAQRVVANSMQPSFLHVETKVIKGGDVELDIENILNRISFPIFGRR